MFEFSYGCRIESGIIVCRFQPVLFVLTRLLPNSLGHAISSVAAMHKGLS